MAEAETQPRRLSADNQSVSKADVSMKERFFRYFQHEITGMFPLVFRRYIIIKPHNFKRPLLMTFF